MSGFDGLVVNHAGLDEASERLSSAVKTIGSDLDQLESDLKPLQHEWSGQAQAAYAFVSAVFTSLYDHMPVYVAAPSVAERSAAAVLIERAAAGVTAADVVEALPVSSTGSPIPSPRAAGPGERIPA